jgi:PAS domain S-box-containing protein
MTDRLPPLILVVEDDPGVAILQRRRLERTGFRVEVAGDLEGAMSALSRGEIELVIMDYRLGQTTGLDLHRRMKTAGFDLPVIIVSGSMDDRMVIEAIRAGVRDVVVKNTGYLDYLPEAVRGVLNQTAAAGDRVPDTASAARILIVEDDVGVATLERKQLERAGYLVTVAATADEAIDAVQGGTVTAAVLDLQLPGGTSGIELYERLKADGWILPAVLVTAYPDQAVAIRALRAGIRDFVPKSGDFLDYLSAAVDRVVGQARVERKLVESELRLASIVGTALDAILMCNAQLNVLLFNRSAEEMFGYSSAEAVGRGLNEFIPQLAPVPHAGGDSGPSGVAQQRVEVEGVQADGTRVPIEVSVSDVVVHGRRLFTVIARDISERKRIEGELRDADRRKDQFLGMLAHELRNPLAAIMTAGEVLKLRLNDPSTHKLMAVITRQTRALSRMVDDLLDVSRVTLGKIQLANEPLLLGQVVSRAVEGIRDAAAANGLQLEIDVDQEPVWLNGDATRLEQVLANLLQNALKFTASGGRIRVRAGAEGDHAVIRVRDTGIGIEPALLPRVFDLFVQADTSLDRSKSGLGIGLALVRQIVSLHGGSVAAYSEGAGRGAEFVVRLPMAIDAERGADAPEGGVRPATRSLRILVVDDQHDIADSLAMLLGSLGHHVRAVYDGATALALCRSERPEVMFVDLGMPGMSGYDVAEQVRRSPELAGVLLIALTGYGREDDRVRARHAGFHLHLTKPVTDAQLQAVLSAASDGRLSPPVPRA